MSVRLIVLFFLFPMCNKLHGQQFIKELNRIEFDPESYSMSYDPAKIYIKNIGNQHLLLNAAFEVIDTIDAYHPRVMYASSVLIKKGDFWGLIQSNGNYLVKPIYPRIYWDEKHRLVFNSAHQELVFDPEKGQVFVY